MDNETQNTISQKEFLAFFEGYIEAAIWSSTLYEPGSEEPIEAEDFVHNQGELSPAAKESMRYSCCSFLAYNENLLLQANNQGRAWGHLGHDFWLTRNGHGTGFWDRGLGELGEKLTQAAHLVGESHLYITDSNEIGVEAG